MAGGCLSTMQVRQSRSCASCQIRCAHWYVQTCKRSFASSALQSAAALLRSSKSCSDAPATFDYAGPGGQARCCTCIPHVAPTRLLRRPPGHGAACAAATIASACRADSTGPVAVWCSSTLPLPRLLAQRPAQSHLVPWRAKPTTQATISLARGLQASGSCIRMAGLLTSPCKLSWRKIATRRGDPHGPCSHRHTLLTKCLSRRSTAAITVAARRRHFPATSLVVHSPQHRILRYLLLWTPRLCARRHWVSPATHAFASLCLGLAVPPCSNPTRLASRRCSAAACYTAAHSLACPQLRCTRGA
jgi:hypothetical protein